MTVRECLERPGIIRQAIMLKLTRIETLRKYAVPSSCGLDPVRVKATLDPARMQALLADAADEEKEVTRLKEELSQAAFEAAILISKLPDVTIRGAISPVPPLGRKVTTLALYHCAVSSMSRPSVMT